MFWCPLSEPCHPIWIFHTRIGPTTTLIVNTLAETWTDGKLPQEEIKSIKKSFIENFDFAASLCVLKVKANSTEIPINLQDFFLANKTSFYSEFNMIWEINTNI